MICRQEAQGLLHIRKRGMLVPGTSKYQPIQLFKNVFVTDDEDSITAPNLT